TGLGDAPAPEGAGLVVEAPLRPIGGVTDVQAQLTALSGRSGPCRRRTGGGRRFGRQRGRIGGDGVVSVHGSIFPRWYDRERLQSPGRRLESVRHMPSGRDQSVNGPDSTE